MLTKRQLEDAARCTIIDCAECSMYCINTIETTRRSAQTAIAYREMLERLEWQSFAGEHGFIANCPMCGGAKPDVLGGGHEPDCELAALLKESEGEKMKPDGVSDNVYNDLINALDKAITLIYTILNMSTTSTRNAVVPWDTIHRWENLVKYARKESEGTGNE